MISCTVPSTKHELLGIGPMYAKFLGTVQVSRWITRLVACYPRFNKGYFLRTQASIYTRAAGSMNLVLAIWSHGTLRA